MRSNNTILVAVCSAITATAISFGVAQAGNSAPQAQSASDRQIVRAQAKTTRAVQSLNRSVRSLSSQLEGDLNVLDDNAATLLRRICVNTNPRGPVGC